MELLNELKHVLEVKKYNILGDLKFPRYYHRYWMYNSKCHNMFFYPKAHIIGNEVKKREKFNIYQ